jgi:enoyl-[acyl-carrier protein] reductase/trans-2-enoyl-CoA reductase (NAD+)
LADIEGFRSDFMRIFGFGIENVDYDADQDLGSKELSTNLTT